MKKGISLCLIVLLLAGMIVPAAAETYYGDPDWQVTFNGSALVSNFTSADIAEAIAEMQPGDNTIFTVNLYNNVSNQVRWYMTNATLYSLEDRSANSATEGGAYTYYLTYTDASGATTVLFDSDTVGGEAISPAGEGLHEATDALEEYFFLDNLASQARGVIRLEVKLDGETQGNDYQDTLADIQMNFAVEGSSTPTRTVVKTGDDTMLTPLLIIMGISGVLLLALAIYSLRSRRKGGAAE